MGQYGLNKILDLSFMLSISIMDYFLPSCWGLFRVEPCMFIFFSVYYDKYNMTEDGIY